MSRARGFLVVVISFPPLGHKIYSPHLSSVHICFFLMLEDKLPRFLLHFHEAVSLEPEKSLV